MAEAGTLHDAFIDELRDTYDAEKQLTKALPKMAKAAKSPELRTALEAHLEETMGQIERLERVFESLDEKVRGKHCDGMAGIIEEGKSIMGEDFDDATMDACLIAAGQRAEHYEMAAYGTLVAWARGDGARRGGEPAPGDAGGREGCGREAHRHRRVGDQPGRRRCGAPRGRRRRRRRPVARPRRQQGRCRGGREAAAAAIARTGAACQVGRLELSVWLAPAVPATSRKLDRYADGGRVAATSRAHSMKVAMAPAARRSRRAVSVPVDGTALLLIDVINDLDFPGSDALVVAGRRRWPRRWGR